MTSAGKAASDVRAATEHFKGFFCPLGDAKHDGHERRLGLRAARGLM